MPSTPDLCLPRLRARSLPSQRSQRQPHARQRSPPTTMNWHRGAHATGVLPGALDRPRRPRTVRRQRRLGRERRVARIQEGAQHVQARRAALLRVELRGVHLRCTRG